MSLCTQGYIKMNTLFSWTKNLCSEQQFIFLKVKNCTWQSFISKKINVLKGHKKSEVKLINTISSNNCIN